MTVTPHFFQTGTTEGKGLLVSLLLEIRRLADKLDAVAEDQFSHNFQEMTEELKEKFEEHLKQYRLTFAWIRTELEDDWVRTDLELLKEFARQANLNITEKLETMQDIKGEFQNIEEKTSNLGEQLWYLAIGVLILIGVVTMICMFLFCKCCITLSRKKRYECHKEVVKKETPVGPDEPDPESVALVEVQVETPAPASA